MARKETKTAASFVRHLHRRPPSRRSEGMKQSLLVRYNKHHFVGFLEVFGGNEVTLVGTTGPKLNYIFCIDLTVASFDGRA